MSAELTLGAEEELHLIDLASWELSAQAPQVLSRLPSASYSAEIQRTTVETNTAVVTTLSELREELLRLRKELVAVAGREGLGVAAVGTSPRSTFADFELTTTGRYSRMQEQYRLLVDEQLICGTQIHVGVSDRDLAVDIAQRIARDLPVLLALSASSPFWNGQDTGYASIRSIIWQRWPTAGSPGPLASAREYDELLADLIGSGVIADAKMAYFDVRPSSHAPTLELRVCDACPLVDDAVLIAGLFRAMLRAAELDIEAGRPYLPVPPPLHRAALWQAARSGLSRDLVAAAPHPRPRPGAEVVRGLLDRLRPQLEELGDWDAVSELTETALARGNSADRQRAVYAERGDLDDVMRLVVDETHGPAGGPVMSPPALRRYRSRAGDEAIGAGSVPRVAYRELMDVVGALPPEEVLRRERVRASWLAGQKMTFRVDGEERPFAVDLVPRVIARHEWQALRAGLIQRARALEHFLGDVYGEQKVLADGVVPRDVVLDCPGWRPEATGLPADAVRAPVMGFDIVRTEYGDWRVLEDNVRNPSGAAYAIAVRRLVDDVMPDLPRPPGLADPATGYALLRSTLLARAEPGTSGALLSSGPDSSAWFEHRRLAEGAGLLLVGADDLDIVGGHVVPRAGGRPIGSLYLRLDEELADLVDSAGRPIGAEVLEVAATGAVVLANTPGTGVADDKAMYCWVPELIGYYLDEHPLLQSVPTYRPGDETERRAVLERIGELVTKPVDGYGGAGVLIGPAASASEVAARRAELAARPTDWVAQEVVALSSAPSLDSTGLHPRHVDLRAFVYLTGTDPEDCRVPDLGLTRVAAPGELVVNSSRGGGAKDTWIVLGPEEGGQTHVRTGR
ncbi:carboxylate--amine ligase/circularly permuted type 2 ATP-grasp protein [Geodermatophilus sabuli]|uniref:Putative glutamate--cysteine ligase 2 n=1 Tax=Geodermatophilus sabuli TaxID=1564158 RepID=A0A285EC73_9ACTN|nr:carboxylate--amine ligase/circularly permuted type 2 ATP-grasp protein [Geodermatophilus sabuli]MBB3084136.1 carboxylate-amine ligase [Geodermatophilus sabuli]SNX96590.1 carboxylate-amine ligase [Geodermatophilus sabuli]